ncbi:DUF1803 domain-containing protein [Streptococcus catagoni]|uniref:DUF1803 domain-containing protein n=1 Tax=Streptococcus catagoni TaxID=2654874 RepID=UPI001409B74B|nr:DUF1803 domain-containing protein [Streptococcus catagoni]
MIKIYNPNKLTKQRFFQELINYLDQNDRPILRQIKKAFPQEKNLDRCLEDYIQAGYILRKDKRYQLNIPLLTDMSQLVFDQMVFIDIDSDLYQTFLNKRFESRLTNNTNDLLILEETDFARNRLTLSNYFYKLQKGEQVSSEQLPLFQILGDVNPDYALKYLSNFLIKFCRKDLVMQKRPDIFCRALEILGYIKEVDENKYQLTCSLDKEALILRSY